MGLHIINGERAYVTYDRDRAYWKQPGWVAVWDGYDGGMIDNETPSDDPIGTGYTMQEAIDDLLEQSL